MKFEEALAKMRLGAKIRLPNLEDDVYFQAYKVGIIFEDAPQESWPISIVKMKGDRKHGDMFKINSLNMPFSFLMSDDWEIID